MCVYESESERGEREGNTRENKFVHGKLLAGIHGTAIHDVEREREAVGWNSWGCNSRRRERERGREGGGEGGREEKVGFCF
jgi:hypothetical protein